MATPIRIALIGDSDATIPAHQAIPLALRNAANVLDNPVLFTWLATDELTDATKLEDFDGIWCVPGSPYRDMDGALRAIRFAREQHRPFLGTCGGFQHAVIEYARNVLGWTDADHGETAPDSPRAVISLLSCALVEATGSVRLRPGSRIANAYGREQATEGYRCRFGLNPAFQAALVAGPLRVAAEDEDGEIRAIELDDHPFFVATLFQPERAALRGETPMLVAAFVQACIGGTS